MILLAVVASVIGSLAGMFTGLVPGIHVNTLASVMLMAYPALVPAISDRVDPAWTPMLVAVLIVSASVVHSFVDFVPSVFTGAPDPDEVLSVLPGHRLLMEGRGMAAVRSAAVGSIVGAFSALILAIPLQYLMLAGLAERLDLLTFTVLSFTVAVMVIQAQGHRLLAVALMLLSGALGFISMHGNIPCAGMLGDGTLLFPILAGLFGMPALLTSVGNAEVPRQRDDDIDPVGAVPGIKGVVMGCIAGITYCRIYANGDVTPCPYLPISAGNVREQSFAEIWHHSEVFSTLRDISRLTGKCGRCHYRSICGGCRARAYQGGGTLSTGWCDGLALPAALHGELCGEDPWCPYDPGEFAE